MENAWEVIIRGIHDPPGADPMCCHPAKRTLAGWVQNPGTPLGHVIHMQLPHSPEPEKHPWVKLMPCDPHAHADHNPGRGHVNHMHKLLADNPGSTLEAISCHVIHMHVLQLRTLEYNLSGRRGHRDAHARAA
jgi:hypothetical protein